MKLDYHLKELYKRLEMRFSMTALISTSSVLFLLIRLSHSPCLSVLLHLLTEYINIIEVYLERLFSQIKTVLCYWIMDFHHSVSRWPGCCHTLASIYI